MRYITNTELVGAILNGCVADARKLLRDSGAQEHVVSKRVEFARAVAMMLDRGYVEACFALWAARHTPAFTDAAYRVSEQVANDLYCSVRGC